MSAPIDTAAALTYFMTHDPRMADLLEQALSAPDPVQVPTPKPASAYFESIVSAIIGQQISTKAADAVRQRVITTLGEVTPQAVLDTDVDALRAAGLSGQKVKYLKHNAAVWEALPYRTFPDLPDEAIVSELIKLYGIGRWTAEMFLMFSMARPDVFSYGDLGLMQGLYEQYEYRAHYTRKIAATVESWRPHRTVASLTLWFHKDNGPVLL